MTDSAMYTYGARLSHVHLWGEWAKTEETLEFDGCHLISRFSK